MGGCQNYGPFLGPCYDAAPSKGIQKGTIILTTTHMIFCGLSKDFRAKQRSVPTARSKPSGTWEFVCNIGGSLLEFQYNGPQTLF